MKQRQAITMVERIKRVFSTQELNGLGKEVGYCQRERVDLDVCWHNAQHPLCCRLVVGYNRKTREFRYLLTNTPPHPIRPRADRFGLQAPLADRAPLFAS